MYSQIAENLTHSSAIAVETLGTGNKYSYRQLACMVSTLAQWLEDRANVLGRRTLKVGLYMRSSVEWVAADLALLFGQHVEIPIPIGFTLEQCRSMLQDADLCLVDADSVGARELSWFSRDRIVTLDAHTLLEGSAGAIPRWLGPSAVWRTRTGTAVDEPRLTKAIHTSGTTGAPKGVLISRAALEHKVAGLASLVSAEKVRRYVSLVPMSLLIEQLSAIYLPLYHGGAVAVLPPQEVSLTGGGLPASYYLQYLRAARPTFLTAPPSIVQAIARFAVDADLSGAALCTAVFGTAEPPLIACGGASAPVEALRALEARGLPVYEGYGLSEYTAVVAWNLPGAARLGTVGRPLSDCEVKLDEDGELLIRGPCLFSGYLGKDPGACDMTGDGFLRTGDIAEIDADGFIRIVGRRKSIIINSSARKISAEWVEGKLSGRPGVREAFVFGDGKSFPVALIFSSAVPADENAIVRSIVQANQQLPDYARVRNYRIAELSNADFLRYVTVTGRPRREEALKDLCPAIDALFQVPHPRLRSDVTECASADQIVHSEY